MVTKKIKIQIQNSMEARPVAVLVQVASQFTSSIYVEYGDKKVNAKSIMGVMMLAAEKGARLTLTISGPDEIEAHKALKKVFKENIINFQSKGLHR